MTVLSASNGQSVEFTLDIDKLVEYEDAHPTYSIFKDFEFLSSAPRIGTIMRLASFVGVDDWKAFVKQGFGIADLATIYSESFEELGFSTSEAVQAD